MKRVTGATPLIALEAVAIDTETTGLDTATARIVQIGAVPVSRGKPKPNAGFQAFVDPGIAIPPGSTAIHGIVDGDVEGAPRFPERWRELADFAGGRVLLGYSIGFDLAVMEKEAGRASMAWTKPRSLCVRLLSAIANPNLPDQSLETIAAWLGLPIHGRHSAQGDAEAAAAIFAGLLPRLSEKGVCTLGEAERACLGLTADIELGRRAGWAEPVIGPDEAAHRALGGIDPYAYRHRVRDVMSSPPVIVRSSMPMKALIDLMVARRISSVFVSDRGQPERPIADHGILTERDMMRKIASEGEQAFRLEAGPFATKPLVSIRADAFVYRAVGRMDRLKIRHLAVRDDENKLVGIVSARDLLRLRAGAAISLDDAIEAAETAEDMAAAWSTLPAVAASLIAEGVDARAVAEIVSEELRGMTRRAAMLAEAAMTEDGHGAPPCPYAVLVLGSGGRGESLLAADQDNAVVFSKGAPDGSEDRWFAEFGRRVADILDTAGAPYCKGGVMARNPQWRGSLAVWKARIEDWVRRSRPEDLLNVDIFYDLTPVHGDLDLGRRLLAFALDRASEVPAFAKLFGEQLGQSESPFMLFGGLKSDNGRIDLKLHGLFPVVATARALAIRHDVRATSTSGRLDGLIALDIGGERDMTAMRSGHAFLLSLLLAQQSRDLETGVPVSNRVELPRLTRDEQAELKSVLKQIRSAPDLVRDLMFE